MAEWNKTKVMGKRLGLEDRVFAGRPVISMDSPIIGGVYLGEGTREAIVVDDRYPGLKKLYRIANERLKELKIDIIFEEDVLKVVYDTVMDNMRYSEDDVKKIVIYYDAQNDEKISLGVFIEHGVGVCRHHSLACGALIELFGCDGFLKGKASVDRNKTSIGSHAWCRYQKNSGEIYILDVTKRYFGNLLGGHSIYMRPDDMGKFEAETLELFKM